MAEPKSPDTLKPNGNAIIKAEGAWGPFILSVATGPFRGPFAINLNRCVPVGGTGAYGPFPPHPPVASQGKALVIKRGM